MSPSSTIEQFKHKKIAVIGDVMLDRYIHGKVDRISPEAPIPIVVQRETMSVPGGAGNAAANIASLGASCDLYGVIGDDHAGRELTDVLTSKGIGTQTLVHVAARPTTVKTRVLGNHQQIVRIDHETSGALEAATTQELIQTIKNSIHNYDAILLCDYSKGVIDADLVDAIRHAAKDAGIPVLADVRPEHRDIYHNLSVITPNRKELSGMVSGPLRTIEEVKDQGLALAKSLNTNLVVTLSEDGLMVINYVTGHITHLPTKAQEVTDVSGAGDTVIATMTLALATHAELVDAATLANHAASVVVAKLGTATLTPHELEETFYG